MGEPKCIPLRVLYTVNTSPQYVLAKSLQNVPVTIIHDNSGECSSSASSTQVYGRTGLQFCALAICQSSPEVAPDGTKDYSVYVLDPLEDIQSRARYGASAANSRGVAVGMGLLSAMLHPYLQTNLQVTGTIIGCDTDDVALEVVISLRQVQTLPSFVTPMAHHHMANMQPYGTSNPASKRKQSNAKIKDDASKPIFATTPLPSFKERSSQKTEETVVENSMYHIPPSHFNPHYYYPPHPGYPGQMPPMMPHPPYFAPGSHANDNATALLPDPYLGPSKRQRGKTKVSASPSDIIEIGDSPKTDQPSRGASENSNTSDLLPSSDASDADVSCCPTPDIPSIEPHPSLNPSAAQNAAILSALSSVSSSKLDLSGINSGTPSPELVNLLKLYIAAIESQGSTGDAPRSEMVTVRGDSYSIPLPDKENAAPSAYSARPSIEKLHQGITAASTTPFGIGAYNVKAQTTAEATANKESLNSLEKGRKRRLSDCADKEGQTASDRRTALSRSKRTTENECHSFTSFQEGSSKRLDTGHSSKTQLSVGRPLFRSTGESSSMARKGPYVVPEWARGVPAPSPPRRSVLEDVMERKSKAKKADKIKKSKSMSRLGGKNHGAQTSPPRPNADRSSEFNELEKMLSESLSDVPEPSTTQCEIPIPPSNPLSSRMPLIAQSSPASSVTRTSVFRAFDTSPLRPARSRTSSGEALPPSTPLRGSTDSVESEELFSPLFTPSPCVKSTDKTDARKLPGFEVPPSPSPAQRRPRSVTPTTTPNHDSEAEDSDCRSNSLPIASDDDFVFKRPATPVTPRPRHTFDWRTLDLPPSSPPRTSPVMGVAELPDASNDMSIQESTDSMPNVDFSSGEAGSSSSENLMPSTPKSNDRKMNNKDGATRNWPIFPENIDFSDSSELLSLPDAGACPPDFEVSPSTKAVFEALQNGLGGEDFSEAWKLVSDVMQPTLQDLDGSFGTLSQDWFSASKDSTVNVFSAVSSRLPAEAASEGEIDVATMAATAFEDLLSGCLV